MLPEFTYKFYQASQMHIGYMRYQKNQQDCPKNATPQQCVPIRIDM